MHALFSSANSMTHNVIGSAIEVHKNKARFTGVLDIPLGLIINFNVLKLTDGLSRLILPGANTE